MLRLPPLAASLILGAALVVAAPAAAADYSPAEVEKAERAFAADGLVMGIKGSFLKHSSPEAIVFRPGPVNTHAYYGARPDRTHPPLAWWPVWAGISRSGDLGFTTGPATFGGQPSSYYFTVWKRQADGGWKWVFDGGGEVGATPQPPPSTPTAYLPVSDQSSASPAAAMAEIDAVEARLADAAASDAAAAYAAVTGADTRLRGRPGTYAADAEARAAEIAWRGGQISFSRLGGEASAAGDLAWTYGSASWTTDGKPVLGHYVRIWQKRSGGWALVFDEVYPNPPAA